MLRPRDWIYELVFLPKKLTDGSESFPLTHLMVRINERGEKEYRLPTDREVADNNDIPAM